jgi:DHA2 family multidrug resistance protein
MAIITREFPPEKRGIALAFWSMAASASVSLGPTLGGYLIDRYSWHTIFDVNVPVGIFGMLASAIVLRERKVAGTGSFDLVGFVSLASFLTALLLALATGNSAWNTGGWTSDYILTCFAISAVSLAVFLTTEFTIEHPLIQLGLFKNFNFGICNIALFLLGVGMFGSIFLLPIYLQDSLGYTPLQAGLVFLPVGVLQGVVAPMAGWFSDRFTPKIPAILGLLLMSFTFYQLSSLSLYSGKEDIMFPLILRGIAIGALFAPLMTLAIVEMPHHKMAQASGLLNVVRQIGGSFGVAVFGTLLARRTIFHAAMYGEQASPYSDIYQQTVMRLQGWAVHTAGSAASQAVAQAKALIGSFIGTQAFISAVDDVFLLSAGILVLGVVPLIIARAHHPTPGGPRGGKPAGAEVE